LPIQLALSIWNCLLLNVNLSMLFFFSSLCSPCRLGHDVLSTWACSCCLVKQSFNVVLALMSWSCCLVPQFFRFCFSFLSFIFSKLRCRTHVALLWCFILVAFSSLCCPCYLVLLVMLYVWHVFEWGKINLFPSFLLSLTVAQDLCVPHHCGRKMDMYIQVENVLHLGELIQKISYPIWVNIFYKDNHMNGIHTLQGRIGLAFGPSHFEICGRSE
jgi:hypothetical protein